MALTYAQLMGYWIAAGGDPAAAPTMAAIAFPESSADPLNVQQGQPYSTTGWGLWQITPGNSVPTVGVDKALLDPMTNARAAVAKYNASKTARGNGFLPWTTYTSGKYLRYMQTGVSPELPGGPAGMIGSSIGAALAAAGAAGGLDAAGTGPTSCLIGFNGVDVPLFGTQGSFCVLSKSEGRAIIGALILLAGGVTMLIGGILLVGSVPMSLPAATPAAPKPIATPAPVTAPAPAPASVPGPAPARTTPATPSATPARPPRQHGRKSYPGTSVARGLAKTAPLPARAALTAAVPG